MDDLQTQYSIGKLESTIENLKQEVDYLRDDIREIKASVKKFDSWANKTTGIFMVLSTIGAVALYFASEVITFIRIKFGI